MLDGIKLLLFVIHLDIVTVPFFVTHALPDFTHTAVKQVLEFFEMLFDLKFLN